MTCAWRRGGCRGARLLIAPKNITRNHARGGRVFRLLRNLFSLAATKRNDTRLPRVTAGVAAIQGNRAYNVS